MPHKLHEHFMGYIIFIFGLYLYDLLKGVHQVYFIVIRLFIYTIPMK